MRKREAYILGGVIVLAIVAGSLLGVKSFAQNILSSVADLGIGIFIAFYLVDRISSRERRARWQHVRAITYDSIEAICGEMAFQFQIDLMTDQWESSPDDRPPIEKELYENFNDLKHGIIARITEISKVSEVTSGYGEFYQYELSRASSQNLYGSLAPMTEQLFLYSFPRILELDEAPNLIQAFIAVENTYREWASTIDLIEGWGAPEEFAWEQVAAFCGDVSNLLKAIYEARRSETTVETSSDLNRRDGSS
jgi:hypothetical protein